MRDQIPGGCNETSSASLLDYVKAEEVSLHPTRGSSRGREARIHGEAPGNFTGGASGRSRDGAHWMRFSPLAGPGGAIRSGLASPRNVQNRGSHGEATVTLAGGGGAGGGRRRGSSELVPSAPFRGLVLGGGRKSGKLRITAQARQPRPSEPCLREWDLFQVLRGNGVQR